MAVPRLAFVEVWLIANLNGLKLADVDVLQDVLGELDSLINRAVGEWDVEDVPHAGTLFKPVVKGWPSETGARSPSLPYGHKFPSVWLASYVVSSPEVPPTRMITGAAVRLTRFLMRVRDMASLA